MLTNVVTVTDTDINTHEQTQHNMYLKRKWSVNAKRPLSTTLAIPVMSAVSQNERLLVAAYGK